MATVDIDAFVRNGLGLYPVNPNRVPFVTLPSAPGVAGYLVSRAYTKLVRRLTGETQLPNFAPGIYKYLRSFGPSPTGILEENGLSTEPFSEVISTFRWKTAVVGTATIAALVWYLCHEDFDDDYWAQWRTWILCRFGTRVENDVRTKFQTGFKYNDQYKSPDGHSHGEAAAERTSATTAIDNWCLREGYQVYAVSGAVRDGNNVGYHQFYMARDVLIDPQNKPIKDSHVIKMVDCDYYVNMKKWLRHCRPMVLYTMAPVSVAGKLTGEGHFTIINDKVEQVSNGGSPYAHPVWDYATDWVVVDYGHWYQPWSWRTVVSSVEYRMISKHRRVVLITPEYQITGLLGRLLPGKRLERVRYKIAPGINRIDATDENGDRTVSLGREGKWLSVDMTYDLYEATRVRVAESKRANIFSIERYLAIHKEVYPAPAESAAHLFDIFQHMPLKMLEPLCQPIGGKQREEMITFQAVGTTQQGFFVTDDGKPNGRVVAPSLTDDPGCAPVDSYNNDLATIIGRVQKPYNQKTPPEAYNRYAAEFAKLLIPDDLAGTGVPWSIDQVVEQQSKPAQTARNEAEFPWMTEKVKCAVKAFMKHETYGAVNHPRNISQVPTDHTLQLASFCYPFKEAVLKPLDWYIPGKSPTFIADRLRDYAKMFDELAETDYSRWDGTVSIWMRATLERSIYARWVHPHHRRILLGLIDSEIGARGKTKQGLPYLPAGTRLSGSLLTTDSNTMMNAFHSFAAARRNGLSVKQAWDCLGLYAGDDGITGIAKSAMDRVAEEIGTSLKCVARKVGEQIMFLGRLFLDPWSTNTSVQDPTRTWRKLHISHAPAEVPDHVAAFNRASGYLSLDPNAPITADWCRNIIGRVVRDHPHVASAAERFREQLRRDTPYFVCQSNDTGEGTWPQPSDDCPLACQRVAESCGVDSEEIRRLQWLIRMAGSDAEIERIIHLDQAPPKIGAVIHDGDCLRTLGSGDTPVVLPSARVVGQRYRDACHDAETSMGQVPTPVSGSGGAHDDESRSRPTGPRTRDARTAGPSSQQRTGPGGRGSQKGGSLASSRGSLPNKLRKADPKPTGGRNGEHRVSASSERRMVEPQQLRTEKSGFWPAQRAPDGRYLADIEKATGRQLTPADLFSLLAPEA